MSDNIRAALYGADYYGAAREPRLGRRPALVRVVGKHCESRRHRRARGLPARPTSAPATSLAVPATGAYHFSLASNYNLVTRPAVVAVREGARTCRAPRDHRRPPRPRRRATRAGAQHDPVQRAHPHRPARRRHRRRPGRAQLLEHGEEFEARVGAPLALAGVAVRDLDAPRTRALPRELLTTDARASCSAPTSSSS